ncbi:hypothetical protein A2Y83_05390 [Candidatus Falkowbacteria bacterium RBG_13_39_14]|uniref:Aspartyl/glutamyl-tRNA(Asn/Gln) amidotransferase subunit C n=1 Tax=Candidatus Falkowbacteria bacterium RBG_13_39_14 TaxID=1797985 RepID=A0A1F5S0Z8_9BACT|nr:MAG: hypothetical protein A2Y83_05390 [Candidatus Falkowbacteria bacterium RBG_13_39_14]
MSINKTKIEEIAKLARIKLSEEEKQKYEKQFSSILDYFEQLKEVDTENVGAFINSNTGESIMREDIIEGCEEKASNDILEEVPERKGRYVKVKKVL